MELTECVHCACFQLILITLRLYKLLAHLNRTSKYNESFPNRSQFNEQINELRSNAICNLMRFIIIASWSWLLFLHLPHSKIDFIGHILHHLNRSGLKAVSEWRRRGRRRRRRRRNEFEHFDYVFIYRSLSHLLNCFFSFANYQLTFYFLSQRI